MDKKKAINSLLKQQKNKKQKKKQIIDDYESDDRDFVERDMDYSGDFSDYDQEHEEKKKKQNMMRLMASNMITTNKDKKKDVVDVKKADAILENLFAEDDEENNNQEEQMEEEFEFGQSSKQESVFQNQNSVNKKRTRNDFDQTYKSSINQMNQQQNKVNVVEEESLGFEGVENLLKLDEEQKKMEQMNIQQKEPQQMEEESINFDEIEQMIQKDIQEKQKQKVQQIQQQKQFLQQNKTTIDKMIMTAQKQNQNIKDIQEEDGSMNVFFIDLYEDDRQRKGKLYLVGKVLNKKTNEYESITLIIQNNIRELYFVPKDKKNKQELMDEVKDIMERKYLRLRPETYQGNFEKLNYAFELDIPRGKSQFYTVQYPFEYDTLPSDLTGQHFKFVLGTTYTALELFLLQKKLMGPQWIKVQNAQMPKRAAESNCRYEFDINNYQDDIELLDVQPEQPQLKCVSIALKSFRNPLKKDQLEILELSMVLHDKINTDKLTDMVGFHKKSFVRPHVQGKQLPYDFEKKKLGHVLQVTSEYAILQGFVDFIQAYDPDIILGHDIYGEIMDILITRIERNNVKAAKMARLCNLPLNLHKSASNPIKVRSLTKGRLVVDTYMQAKELVRDTDYNLTQMVSKHLNQERVEVNITYENLDKIFDSTKNINTLVDYLDKDAQFTLELMFKLQVVPLTKQLTNIAGNLWNRSLQNQRAERNELLLMHRFYEKAYIVPDKYKKRFNNDNNDDDGKKQKKYAGGMVFEPKAGYYEDYVLLLDFNSLYPSIIQEFNLCFSTVERPSLSLQYYHGTQQKERKIKGKAQPKKQIQNPEEKMEEEDEDEQKTKKQQQKEDDYEYPEVPDKELKWGILPKIIKYLVERRKQVKNEMKSEKNEQLKNSLDIKQLAFKLVANSMYGCLGFESSRFYARPIAALITKQGRDIIKNSYDMVHKMNYDVIYGDTDSLMIYPKTKDLMELFKVGHEIKKQVSKQYKNLIFDIDGVYKSMLLLKKKKYSCLKLDNFGQIMQNPTERQLWKKEMKGLDIVRRDWSVISKKAGNEILDIILQDNLQNSETRDIVTEIYGKLTEIKERIDQGKFELSDYYITKVLTKDPSAYPDGGKLPHVTVAKRLIQSGKKQAVALIGKVIYFIVCKLPDNQSSNSNLSLRAFAPEEVAENNYQIDYEYYKSNQILSVIERMVNVLPNISRKTLAECLGLDGSKYQNREVIKNNEDTYNDECEDEQNDLFQAEIEKNLKLKCFRCMNEQVFKGLQDIKTITCSKCNANIPIEYISNKLRKFIRDKIQIYNKQKIECTKGSCANPYQISQFYLNRQPCQQCYQGKYEKSYGEKQLQVILKGIRGILDMEKEVYKKSANILTVEYANSFRKDHEFVSKILLQSSYEHVSLIELFTKAKIIF